MAQGKLELLTPQNCALVLIDHQPQMTFGVANIDRQLLKNNVIGLAKAAKVFNVPTVLTSVETESFSGNIWPELLAVLPDNRIFERTSMNTWDDAGVKAELKKFGRKKLVLAALWTEVCLNFPALEAMADGYEVYFVEDASGGYLGGGAQHVGAAHDPGRRRPHHLAAVPARTAARLGAQGDLRWHHGHRHGALRRLRLRRRLCDHARAQDARAQAGLQAP